MTNDEFAQHVCYLQKSVTMLLKEVTDLRRRVRELENVDEGMTAEEERELYQQFMEENSYG